MLPLVFKWTALTAAVGGCLALASCAQPSPQKAQVAVQPKTPVVKNITSFSESLRCMDDMFVAYGKHDTIITSDGLPDQTGKIQAGTKEMLISTVAKMSAKSGAFRFVDVETRGETVFWIQQNWVGVRNTTVAPTYYIRGAITQADQGVMSDKQSAGVATPFLSLGVGRDQMVTLVSMDMNVGDVVTRQILPGFSSTNTIAIVKREKSADAEGLISKASLTFNITSDQSEGSHQAVRTLVELGTIEVLGKLAHVPYWRCLGIDSTNPEMMATARDWYDELKPDERIRLAQTGLHRAGLFARDIDGVMSGDLHEAIDKYKVANDLIPNGQIDFDLYYSLLEKRMVPGGAPETTTAEAVKPQTISTGSGDGDMTVGLTLRPNAATYRVGDKLSLAVGVMKPSDVYCYYQAADGSVARIFPNRFTPNASLTAGGHVIIPSGNAFSLVLEKSGTKEFAACVATQKPYDERRPAALDEPDLTALREKSIQEVVQQHLDIDKFESSVQVVTIEVK